MFEHLDDPVGFEPSPEFRADVSRRAARLRRRRLRLSAAMAVVIVSIAGIGGALAFVNHQMGSIDRVDVRGSMTPEPARHDAPFTLLLVGIDSRGPGLAGPGLPDQTPRADTIVLVRVDPARRKLTTLHLPRDLYLPIAGTGGSDRLASAVAVAGGPSALITTIRRQLGVDVQHYIEVDFAGAVSIINAVGGIRLDFATPARDLSSGFHVSEPGCQTLDGQATLAYGRSRHYEAFRDGYWQTDPRGDLGRIERSNVVGRALIDSLRRVSAADPVAVVRVVNALAAHATVDDGLSNADLIRLARQLRSATGQQLRLPVHAAFEGNVAVLELSPGWQAVVKAFRVGGPADGASAPPPSVPPDTLEPQPCG